MKFIKKIPPENEEKTQQLLNCGWKRLKEPQNISLAICLSLPLCVVLIILNSIWCYFFYPQVRQIIEGESNLSIQITINKVTIIYLFVLIVYLLLHELIHAVFIPNISHSNKTFWGMNGFFGFVYTEEIVTKSRFLIISIMPLLVLSYLVPVVVSLMGMMNGYVLFLCLLNAGGACVDLLNIILVIVQVPRRGLIINNGLCTFYKAAI